MPGEKGKLREFHRLLKEGKKGIAVLDTSSKTQEREARRIARKENTSIGVQGDDENSPGIPRLLEKIRSSLPIAWLKRGSHPEEAPRRVLLGKRKLRRAEGQQKGPKMRCGRG